MHALLLCHAPCQQKASTLTESDVNRLQQYSMHTGDSQLASKDAQWNVVSCSQQDLSSKCGTKRDMWPVLQKKFSRRGKQTPGLAKQAVKELEPDEDTLALRDTKNRAKEPPVIPEGQEATVSAAFPNREKPSQRGGPVKQGSGAHLPATTGMLYQNCMHYTFAPVCDAWLLLCPSHVMSSNILWQLSL